MKQTVISKPKKKSRMRNASGDLSTLIRGQISLGFTINEIIEQLRRHGVDDTQALPLIETTLKDYLTSRRIDDSLAMPAMPGPAAGMHCGQLFAVDRQIDVLLSIQSPRLVLFGGVLSDEECDALIELAAPCLTRSTALNPTSGKSEVNSVRTSHGTFLRRGSSALVERIDRRLEALLGWPLERSEDLQLLRYKVSQEYEPHFDYFDPSSAGYRGIIERAGQRLASLIIYLSTPESGGSTFFPDAGVNVIAHKGSAVFFSYDASSALTMTRHAGMPVQAGEKWIATRWLRERPFL